MAVPVPAVAEAMEESVVAVRLSYNVGSFSLVTSFWRVVISVTRSPNAAFLLLIVVCSVCNCVSGLARRRSTP